MDDFVDMHPCRVEQSKLPKTSGWINPSFGDFDLIKTAKSSTDLKKTTDKSRKRTFKPPTSDFHASFVSSNTQNNSDLWVEKYHPLCQADLAVHKKKVSEVQSWLNDILCGRLKRAPFLLLTGPAGCGKTATVKVLAKDMNLDIQEWVNPTNDTALPWDSDSREGLSIRSTSQTEQFRDFLLRSNKYCALQISESQTSTRKVILLEEFPNVFFRDSGAFHDALRVYRTKGNSPMVFIVSDGEGSESTERLLFPHDLQAELSIASISFNPVAPTSLSKVLTKILSKESSRTSHVPAAKLKSVVDAVASASLGDIRAAINTLQFNSFKDTAKKTSSSRSQSSLMQMKIDKDTSHSVVGSRDASLFLFRALGKILYCKREQPSADHQEPSLPRHLSHHYRDPLQFSPEEVVEKTHVSGEFFTSFLHQNYIDFFPDMDDLVSASEYLSDADYLTTDWASRTTLREYSSSVAARGLLFSNSSRARAGEKSVSLGWRPLIKPEWFQVIRKYRENTSSAAGLFRLMRLPARELETQLLPYLCRLNPTLQNPAQASLLQFLGHFKKGLGSKMRQERLEEKEVSVASDADDDLEAAASEGQGATHKKTPAGYNEEEKEVTPLPLAEEEIEIEDYDDDW